MIGIYKITNPKGKVYIGQSWDLVKREKYYKCKDCKNQRKLYTSMCKYGKENHLFTIIHNLPNDITQDVLDEYETFYWQQYIDCGFELLNIRKPGSRGKHTEETKKKLSEVNKGKIMLPHVREKLLASNIGKRQTTEHIQKRVLKIRGRKRSEETCKKLSDKAKDRKYSKEALEKRKGRKLKESTKEKLSIINKGKILSEETKKKMSESKKGINTTPIICINTGEKFESLNAAACNFNINRTVISQILCGNTIRSRQGLKFKYA